MHDSIAGGHKHASNRYGFECIHIWVLTVFHHIDTATYLEKYPAYVPDRGAHKSIDATIELLHGRTESDRGRTGLLLA